MSRTLLTSLASIVLAASAQALPMTTFSLNSTGGFDATVYPEVNGNPSLQSAIFTTPQTVNPGYVVILDNSKSKQNNTASWDYVIRFFNSGTGVVNSLQMLVGGPNQSTYFPSLSTVMNSPHSFIVRSSVAGSNPLQFTTFTQYSVKSNVTRNYSFYTLPLIFTAPESESTLVFLVVAIIALAAVGWKYRSA